MLGTFVVVERGFHADTGVSGSVIESRWAAITASYPVTFSIYSAATDGDALWTESHDSVDVVDGLFTVQLGAVTAIDVTALVVVIPRCSIDGGDELQPRMMVGDPTHLWAGRTRPREGRAERRH